LRGGPAETAVRRPERALARRANLHKSASLPSIALVEQREGAEGAGRGYGQGGVQGAGIQLGERYEHSPIVWRDGTPGPPDTWDSYTPLERPGARAPHVWLGKDHALYDDFGKGFTLLDFGAPEEAGRFALAAYTNNMPLTVLALEPPENSPYRSKLVLVRPDQHIGWHGDSAADAEAVIDRVRGA